MDYSEPCQYSVRLIKKLQSLDTEEALDFDLIDKAIYWAKKYHNKQFRKSGEPYYTHPLEVAYLVSEYKLTTNVIVTAILHDIVEDTEVTVGMILNEFGWRIAEMVDRLTRDRPDGSKLSVETILNNAYEKNDKEVLLIKVVDRLHNMQTIGAKSPEKQKKTVNQTFNLFVKLTVFLEIFQIETYIFGICYKHLNLIFSNYAQEENRDPLLYPLKYQNPHQLLSQVYQNNTDLYQKLHKQELI
jgi:(p)ppGpp synthase/HD superfamily hydrolase